MKKNIMIIIVALSSLLLSACSKQVITVTGVVSEETQPTNYIEMQEFELKQPQVESDREKISYCALLVPEGYQASTEIPGMYVHPRAPLDSSNIYYTISESTDDGQVVDSLTQSIYEQTVEEAYKASGQEVDLQIQTFEQIDMEGIPGYKIRSSYTVSDKDVEQLAYIIMAEDTCTITYSQLSDDELMADFEITDGQIKLVKEQDVSLAKQ